MTTTHKDAHPDGLESQRSERHSMLFWTASRLTMLALSLVVTEETMAWRDVGLYADWARAVASGAEPDRLLNEYPPLARAALLLLGAAPSALVYAALFLTAMAALDLGVLRSLCRRTSGRPTHPAVCLWILAPSLLGPVTWTRLDLLPAAAVVLWLTSSTTRRSFWLGIAIAIKLWPLALVPALSTEVRRFRVAALLVLTTGLAFLVPGWLVPGDVFGSVLYSWNRGVQIESTIGSMAAAAGMAGTSVTVGYAFGSWQVDSSWLLAASRIVTALGVALGVALSIRLLRLPAEVRRGSALPTAILLLLVAVLTAKVLSPQYLIWIVATVSAVAATQTLRRPWAVVALVSTICALTHLVYPVLYADLLALAPAGVLPLLVRNLLLLALTLAVLPDVLSTTTSDVSRGSGYQRPPDAASSGRGEPREMR